MARATWNLIKSSKSFYVKTYRLTGTLIVISLMINIFLGMLIVYYHLHRPERDFYASNGTTPPIALTPLSTPNNSAEALLPPDPINDDDEKVIPQ